jgi:hypothetical protein
MFAMCRESVEVVRDGLRAGDVERRDVEGLNGNYAVLVLQNSIDQEELLGREQQTVLLK